MAEAIVAHRAHRAPDSKKCAAGQFEAVVKGHDFSRALMAAKTVVGFSP
jgi:hypothetical protein